MGKIWAKLMTDGKIIRHITFDLGGKIVYSQFYNYATQICQELDIATPLILKPHIFNFAKFNFVRFKQSDFVDNFEYDSLVLEYIFI